MESGHISMGELIVDKDLDLSKIDVENCGSIAGWNLTSKGEDNMNKFSNGTDVIVVRNSERIESAARIGWVGRVIGHRGKDAIIEFEDECIGYIEECDLEAL